MLGSEMLFDEIIERLKVIRKKLYSKEKEKKENKCKVIYNLNQNIEQFFPHKILVEMSKKLPITKEEIESIHGPKIILLKYGTKFLAEINYFLSINDLDKKELEKSYKKYQESKNGKS